MKEKGNSILVNVSVGSKIQAIASMMDFMMFKDIASIKPYYAVPERYNSILMKEDKQETEGLKEIKPMPEYKIEIPNERSIKCLDIINRKAGGTITKRELKDAAIEPGLIHVDEKRITAIAQDKGRVYMSLNKNLIAPLRKWKFITESKEATHHIVSLTADGKHPLKFLGKDIENT